jgi:phage gp45-like
MSLSHTFFGKYGGQVTDIADEQAVGRVKVLVPSVLDDQARWARPCVPYGHFVVPPVGAHVWVEFEAGDPRHPIWVGTFYAAGEVPPAAKAQPSQAPAIRVIHTPAGHTIELHDTAGDERVVIKHAKNAYASIDKDGSVLLANAKGANLYLNAAAGQTTLFSEQGHLLTLNDDGALLGTTAGVALILKDGQASVVGNDKVNVQAKEVNISGGKVGLGAAPQMSVMLAELFAPLFMAHTHPTALGPSGPPIPPLVPQAISSQTVKASP